MFIELDGCKVHYQREGRKKKSMILLHGWGQNIFMMDPIAQHYKNSFSVYNIDLPGFGKSSEPPVSWGVEEYTTLIRHFIEEKKIENPIFVAHSFGARIALLYASQYPTYKMIITGGAGIKPKRGIDYYAKVYSYKALKNITKLPGLNQFSKDVQKSFGSSDYRDTSGVMRESFVKIVNLDLTPVLSKITAEALLIWGENDDATPLWMGKKMEELMPHAGLAIFEGEGHYAYWNQMNRFLRVIDVFLEGDMAS
jgi:Predicted hydrolases or acyltransferases (alpha/beta hydrolase superfamily)